MPSVSDRGDGNRRLVDDLDPAVVEQNRNAQAAWSRSAAPSAVSEAAQADPAPTNSRSYGAAPTSTSVAPPQRPPQRQEPAQPVYQPYNANARPASGRPAFGGRGQSLSGEVVDGGALPPRAVPAQGAVYGTPVYGQPAGQPMGGQQYGYQQYGNPYQQVPGEPGDFEDPQQQCMLICCGVCCPCCIGDPFTAEWRDKCYTTWFQTFLGLTGVVIFVVFLVETILSPHEKNIQGYIALDPDTLKMMGAKDTYEIVKNFQVWRIATCVFLHAGWMHMLMNLFVQMTVGWMMETGIEIADGHREVTVRAPWGFRNTAAIYWSAGITGSLLGCVCAPYTMCVGASGAIIGIIGGKLALLYLTWDQIALMDPHMAFKRKMDACLSVFWVLLIFSLGLGNPLIDNWAHLGGLIGGLLCGGLLFSDEAVRVQDGNGQPPTTFEKYRGKACGAILAGLNVVLLGVLFTVIRQTDFNTGGAAAAAVNTGGTPPA